MFGRKTTVKLTTKPLKTVEGPVFNRTKREVLATIDDPTIRVFVLSGEWGTGKTHLWRAAAQELAARSLSEEPPVYVSLFGARSIDELRSRIAQATLVNGDGNIEGRETADALTKALKSWTPIAGVIANFSEAIYLARTIKGRLVVLDDLERKGSSLSVTDVFSVISYYSETTETRFLLLLNRDRLGDDAVKWAEQREKVVEREIDYKPSVVEAFDAAASLDATPYQDHVRDFVGRLEISNIRVLRRINRVVREVLGSEPTLSSNALSQALPSIVLLAASHLGVLGPEVTVDRVLSYSVVKDHMLDRSKKPAPPGWDEIGPYMALLQISEIDSYDRLVGEGLKSGLFDKTAIAGRLIEFGNNEQVTAAVAEARLIWDDSRWRADATADQLCNRIRSMLVRIALLRPGDVQLLADVALAEGDLALSDQVISDWIAAFAAGRTRVVITEETHADESDGLGHRLAAALNAQRLAFFP